jgi:hypothetical protein
MFFFWPMINFSELGSVSLVTDGRADGDED